MTYCLLLFCPVAHSAQDCVDTPSQHAQLCAGGALPMLLVQVLGPAMRICALASEHAIRSPSLWQPGVSSEPLTHYLNLALVPHRQPQQIHELARALRGLKDALLSLGCYYARPPLAVPPGAPVGLHLLHAHHRIPQALRKDSRFEAITRLTPDRQVYQAVARQVVSCSLASSTAETPDLAVGQPVVLKYALVGGGYGAAVHELWAMHGLAPKLYRVERQPGGGLLVVMEARP